MADESDDEFAVGGTGTLHATGMSTLGALKGKKVKEMQSDVKPPSQKKKVMRMRLVEKGDVRAGFSEVHEHERVLCMCGVCVCARGEGKW